MGTTPAQDYEDITKAIQPYLDGAKAGSGNTMKPSFHKDATVYGYLGDTLVAGPMKLIYDWADSIGPAPQVTPRIVKVDVAGSAANVRIEVDNWQKHRFTDIFNLLKIDGKWVIVNKIFHTHE
ncbi:nuclear transport factor 2 family protein [Hyphomicrobium sp.]|uniref:nuclear transport factor 2 family protein n=1 Tax=Hyphomicrobium sp. TaxID=82 RepID=UPI002FE30B92